MLTSILTLLLAATSLAAASDELDVDDNLYWPGDFESHLVGGIYSSDFNVTLTDLDNHTPGGSHAWALQSRAYQHLELLAPGRGDYALQLAAKTSRPAMLTLKVISPTNAPADTDQVSTTEVEETTHNIALAASTEWQTVRLNFQVAEPFPGPIAGEVLLGGFNSNDEPIYLDDVQLVRLRHRPLPIEAGGEVLLNVAPDAFITPAGETRLGEVIDDKGQPRPAVVLGPPVARSDGLAIAEATIPADRLRGRRVLLEADVAYLSSDPPLDPWAALVIALQADTPTRAIDLSPTPAPHWLPMGQAAPPGKPKIARAAYEMPATAEQFRLRLVLQPGVGANAVAVNRLRFVELGD